VLRNVGSNWVLTLVTIAATYVLTPFIISTLGKEGYGTWTLITAMTGYISLLALGVPMACVRYLAQHVAESDSREMNRVIGSCAGLYLGLGAVAVVVGLALMALFSLYEIPSTIQGEARLAFGLMVVQLSVGFIGLLPEGIMFAHHDFVVRNVIRVIGVLLRFAFTVALLSLHPSLLLLALVQIAAIAFDFGVSWMIIRRRYPQIRISLGDFDRAMVRRIFSFSVFVLLLNAGARLSFETDALVIGAFLGVAAIPYFAVANSLVIYLMDFLVAIAAVVAPMATKLNTEGRKDDLQEIFLKWSKVALSLTVLATLFLIVVGPRFIGWWIDPSFEEPAGRVLQILMLSCIVFLPIRGVALPIMFGLGKPKVPTIAFVVAGVLNLGLSILLVGPLGIAGVALGTAIPNALFGILVLVVTCRELGIPVAAYLEYVVPRVAVGTVPVLGFLLWFEYGADVEGLTGMLAAGSGMVVLFALVWVFFVYRDDRFVSLRPHLIRLRAWSRA
jgi:O-antigen/teichoic acid export membrane protein